MVPLFRCLSDPDYQDEKLGNIPFLNGGLFEFNEAEKDIHVENSWFEAIYKDLLERYNFTVREDTEFEQEVAVDPEMLGTVFEQLILGLESKGFEDIPDPRRGTGSYYTPKFIVAFMVKESLMAFLQETFSDIPQNKLKKLLYDLKAKQLTNFELENIRERLLELKSVDPGVGSGAFPVGLLLKMLEVIEAIDKKLQPEVVDDPTYRYELKRKLITECIYGVDIQERAVQLTELRLWLSLLVEVPEPEPLPNLDLHILTGDSLVSKIGEEIDFNLEKQIRLDATGEKYIDRFKRLKIEYENTHNRLGKQEIKKRVDDAKKNIIRWFLETRKKSIEKDLPQLALMDEKKDIEQKQIKERKSELAKINSLLENIDEMAGTFNWGLDFAEIMTLNGGFDLVIGNPPYGVSVPTSVKNEFRLGSRDSYGVFSALGLTVLRDHGVLCYIMSDTWQTIRTHKELRDRFLKDTDALYLISVPNDTFKATVNPGVYLFRKRRPVQRQLGGNNWIIAADFSPLSIKDGDVEVAFDMLAELDTNGIDDSEDGQTIWSDKDMAIFAYRQNLIPRFSNHSYFIASPKLFQLMQDVGNLKTEALMNPNNESDTLGNKREEIYEINFNRKKLEVVKLGDIADVVQGLATGDNDYYLRQSKENLPGSGKNYDVVDWDNVITADDLSRISSNEALRLSIIQTGIVEDISNPKHKTLTVIFNNDEAVVYEGNVCEQSLDLTELGKFSKRTDIVIDKKEWVIKPNDRYFNGRYIVPCDKGASSDVDEGWIPNYYVPTDYYIDWSERAVIRLQTLTIKERDKFYGRETTAQNPNKICSRFQNKDYYFRKGITFSPTGVYSPTFRVNSNGVFEHKGSLIFSAISRKYLLGILSSSLLRFLYRNYINHTVEITEKPVSQGIMLLDAECKNQVKRLVKKIIEAQKENLSYNFMKNEQVAIDDLVYGAFNLDLDDISEIENWFWRRYPKLAKALDT